MEEMRREAAASALAKQQQERWEQSLASEPLRHARNVGTQLAKIGVGDPTAWDPNADPDTYYARRAAQRAREMGDEEGYRQHTARAEDRAPMYLGPASAHQNPVEARGQGREHSLAVARAEDARDQAQKKASGLKKDLKDYTQSGEKRLGEQQDARVALDAMAWDEIEYLHANADEFGGRGSTEFQEELTDAYDHFDRTVRESEAFYKGRDEARKRFQAFVDTVASDAGIAEVEAIAQGERLQAERDTPVGGRVPGQSDLSHLRDLFEAAYVAEARADRARGRAAAWGLDRTTSRAVDAFMLDAEAAHKELAQEAARLGGREMAGRLLAHFRAEKELPADIAEERARYLREKSPEQAQASRERVLAAQQYQERLPSDLAELRDELGRGVTAGIPGAEPPTPGGLGDTYSSDLRAPPSAAVSPPEIKPGHPGEAVAGAAVLAAGAVPALASANYDRIQDPYEQLRFMSLQGLRRPLKVSDLSPSALGILLQDPELSSRLFSEGLIDNTLQNRLVSKRALHGY